MGPLDRLATLVVRRGPRRPGPPKSSSARSARTRDVRLWLVVLVVVTLAVLWQAVVLAVRGALLAGGANFIPLGLFLVPVLYGAIEIGLAGGLTAAGAAAVMTVPWMAESARLDDPLGVWADAVQVLVLLVVAYFVGKGVEAERRARRAAEASRQATLEAEARYRTLFASNGEPIVLVDLDGVVREANPAAERLFGLPSGGLADQPLAVALGPEAAARVRLLERGAGAPVPLGHGDAAGVFQPLVTPSLTIDGHQMHQVVLRDVTEESARRRRVEAYAADVVRGQEDERRRIAQELHDGPLQTLVHICRQVDLLVDQGSFGVPSPVDRVELRRLAATVADEIRAIARGLRPPQLDDLGLVPALERMGDDVERLAGVAVGIRVRGTVPRLAPAVELAVFRICQEALSNAARHSGAATVSVVVEQVADRLRLEVRDDGDGFVTGGPGTSPPGSLGLAGMAERAALVGADLSVVSTPGQGTTVALELALDHGPLTPAGPLGTSRGPAPRPAGVSWPTGGSR